MFGGVYFWAAGLLSLATAALLVWTVRRSGGSAIASSRSADGFNHRWTRTLNLAMVAIVAGIALQLVPLPSSAIAAIAPARAAYFSAATLQSELPWMLPLTLDSRATAHAWLAAVGTIATFLTARAILAHGGNRTLITCLAWAAVIFVMIAIAQAATGTSLVYGVWEPYDAGARPLGPFINRNHFGTWSLLAFFLCFGGFQWRRASASSWRGGTWRARVAHALNARTLMLVLAQLLLAIGIAIGASRSTLLALACGAGYVAAAAPGGQGTRRSTLWTGALAIAVLSATFAYADIDRLLSRLDETRQLGLSQRVAIWRDTLAVVRDFPLFGVGAGNFSNAMRVYQSTDRTYFWNEAHNEYLQIAAEGGLLLTLPVVAAVVALVMLARRRLRRREDRLYWLRLGASAALVSVAVQAIWETGLSLPANSMLATLAAAILIQPSSHATHHSSDDHSRSASGDGETGY